MESRYDISMTSGDSYELNIIYKDSNKVPINLTDYELYFQIRKSRGDTVIVLDKTFIIPPEDGVLGLIKFSLTSLETEGLVLCNTSSKYVYAMRLSSSDDSDVKTILSGTLEVYKGVI